MPSTYYLHGSLLRRQGGTLCVKRCPGTTIPATMRKKLEKWRKTCEFLEPQPNVHAKFIRPIPPQSLRNRCLQVAVRMYNIVLTPETPEYPGSEWYAETMSNERIIAACFCCFSEENITQGTVEFRECVKSSVEYVEGDKPGLNLVYGIFQDQTQELEILQQHVGQVEITLGADMHTSGITQRVESCISANSGSKVAPQLGSCSHVGETTQDFELVSMSTWKSEIKRADGERARADIEMVKAIRIRNRMIKQAKRIKRGNVAYLKMKASLQSLYETEKMRADNEATRVHGLEKDLESVRENGKTSQSGTDDHEEVAKKRRRTV